MSTPTCTQCGRPTGLSGRCENPDCVAYYAGLATAAPEESSAPPIQPAAHDPPRAAGPSSRADSSSQADAYQPAPPQAAPISGLRTGRKVNIKNLSDTGLAVAELREHRRNQWGRLIALAGPPRHGKSKLAEWIAADARVRPGAPAAYAKTVADQVEVYTVPEREGDQILLDMAGEDFKNAAEYNMKLPALIEHFLWPLFPELNGLILVIALPILWRAWNDPTPEGQEGPQAPSPDVVADVKRTVAQLVDAHRLVLKYAMVAHDLERVRQNRQRIAVSAEKAPTRDEIEELAKAAAPLPIPVFIAFTKADLFHTSGHPLGLNAPPFPGEIPLKALQGRTSPAVSPLTSDPMVLGWSHFPALFDYLSQNVRHFKFDFVQVLRDPNEQPDPEEAFGGEPIYEATELLGARSAMEFLTCDDWRRKALSTAMAVRLSQNLTPWRWSADGVRVALGGSAAATV